ncbi:MAG: isoprenyl transferase [Proteobacteria bacterium]|nr:isoprenyl transferase [Pseudomonadota bacterium]
MSPEILSKPLEDSSIKHLALILDGNGRWALSRGLSVVEGHRQGAEALRNILRDVWNEGIQYLTVYAFSTENWKRSKLEISGIMQILRYNLKKHLNEFLENNIQIRILGDLGKFPKDLISLMENAVEKTKKNTGLVLSFALNYGGRAEITRAVYHIAKKLAGKEITLEEINEDLVSDHLYTAGLPDPDLLIRTGGDIRISNYLLWQMAYTEFLFTDILWPDFSKKELLEGLNEFKKRQRRFGGDQRKVLKSAKNKIKK